MGRDRPRGPRFNAGMDVPVARSIADEPPLVVVHPAEQRLPIIFASPHSGRIYPEEFVVAARLDALNLRRSAIAAPTCNAAAGTTTPPAPW